MKRYCILFGLLFSAMLVHAQEVSTISIKELQKRMQQTENQVLVVNFWATWCKPCVAEMPHFQKARQKYGKQAVAFLFVSLDFENTLESKVIPFVKEKMPGADVVFLNPPNGGEWIGEVEESWEGGIPMTLVINPQTDFRESINKAMSYQELDNLIQKALVQNPSE